MPSSRYPSACSTNCWRRMRSCEDTPGTLLRSVAESVGRCERASLPIQFYTQNRDGESDLAKKNECRIALAQLGTLGPRKNRIAIRSWGRCTCAAKPKDFANGAEGAGQRPAAIQEFAWKTTPARGGAGSAARPIGNFSAEFVRIGRHSHTNKRDGLAACAAAQLGISKIVGTTACDLPCERCWPTWTIFSNRTTPRTSARKSMKASSPPTWCIELAIACGDCGWGFRR